VPVVGWRSSVLAGFLATSAGLRLPSRADTVDELAQLLRQHWALGGAGVVVSQSLTGELAIPSADLAAAETATGRGPERTPAELRHLQDRLGERVILANLALLERNAALAGSLAVALGRVMKPVESQGG
jgi:pseudouridylate synthase